MRDAPGEAPRQGLLLGEELVLLESLKDDLCSARFAAQSVLDKEVDLDAHGVVEGHGRAVEVLVVAAARSRFGGEITLVQHAVQKGREGRVDPLVGRKAGKDVGARAFAEAPTNEHDLPLACSQALPGHFGALYTCLFVVLDREKEVA